MTIQLSDIIAAVSALIALVALGFSIVSYLKTAQDQKRREFRDFLLRSLVTTSRLSGSLVTLRALPQERERFWPEWHQAFVDLEQLVNEKVRWQAETSFSSLFTQK